MPLPPQPAEPEVDHLDLVIAHEFGGVVEIPELQQRHVRLQDAGRVGVTATVRSRQTSDKVSFRPASSRKPCVKASCEVRRPEVAQ